MEKWKRICKKLLFPPACLAVPLTLVSIGALIAVFVKDWKEMPVSYIAYALSAYTATVICAFSVKALPGWWQRIKTSVYAHPRSRRYMTDAAYRVQVSLLFSLGITLAYSVLKLVSGIIYSSLWLVAVALYYILLSVLRSVLLYYMYAKKGKRDILQEYKQYRLCGYIMLILHLSLTGIVIQMVWKNQGFRYPGTLIFAAAAYTFYTVTVSVIDLVKYRKYKYPVLSAAKAIRFAAALVSLLSLETAMLAQFGDDESFRRWMTALTGAGVCAIVLGMSVFMISKANREIGIQMKKAEKE